MGALEHSPATKVALHVALASVLLWLPLFLLLVPLLATLIGNMTWRSGEQLL